MNRKDLIFGTRAVIEAILSGRQIEKIFIQNGLSNELNRELHAAIKTNKVPFTYVPIEKLNRISSRNHQGVICMLSPIEYASLDAIIHDTYSKGGEPFLLVIDRITDVRNFGAIIRTAECLGINTVVISEKGNAPITGDTMKTSAGALNYMPVCREKDLKKSVSFLQENGIRVVACTEKASKNLNEIDLSGPVALILGSEEDGISDSLLRQADDLGKIPMKGQIGSLNVSVAAGVALYEAMRQRDSK